jgi:hypothetical protein
VACASPAIDDATGASTSAITNGVNDDATLGANIVVSLEKPGSNFAACSGTLLTPAVVLASRACVGSERAGLRPIVRVGANRMTAESYLPIRDAVVMEGANPESPPGVGAVSELALVFLDLARPVFDNIAIVPRTSSNLRWFDLHPKRDFRPDGTDDGSKRDNCPGVANFEQADWDDDGVGDACSSYRPNGDDLTFPQQGNQCLDISYADFPDGPARTWSCENYWGTTGFHLTGKKQIKIANRCLMPSGLFVGARLALADCDGSPAQELVSRIDGSIHVGDYCVETSGPDADRAMILNRCDGSAGTAPFCEPWTRLVSTASNRRSRRQVRKACRWQRVNRWQASTETSTRQKHLAKKV